MARTKGTGSTYTDDLSGGVCNRVGEGSSLRSACEAEGVKHPTFLLWCSERPELADRYARARDAGRALRFERLREIASAEPERDERGKIDPGWVKWKKLEIDTEKWSLSKEEPKKYGDKLAVGGAEDLPAMKVERIVREIVKPK